MQSENQNESKSKAIESALLAIEDACDIGMVIDALALIGAATPEGIADGSFAEALRILFDACLTEMDFGLVEDLRLACLGA